VTTWGGIAGMGLDMDLDPCSWKFDSFWMIPFGADGMTRLSKTIEHDGQPRNRLATREKIQ
jgi:hypothetical protein